MKIMMTMMMITLIVMIMMLMIMMLMMRMMMMLMMRTMMMIIMMTIMMMMMVMPELTLTRERACVLGRKKADCEGEDSQTKAVPKPACKGEHSGEEFGEDEEVSNAPHYY